MMIPLKMMLLIITWTNTKQQEVNFVSKSCVIPEISRTASMVQANPVDATLPTGETFQINTPTFLCL